MALRYYIRKHSPKCLKRIDARVAKGEIQPLSKEDLKQYAYCRCTWWYYGTDDQGNVHEARSLKVHSKADAEKKIREFNHAVRSVGEDTLTLRELTNSFLELRGDTGRTDETCAIYKRVGNRLVSYCEKQKPRIVLASKVEPDQIIKLRGEWIKTGLLKDITTINYHVAILGMIFRHGVKTLQKLTKNPVDAVKPIERSKKRGADAEDEDDEGFPGRTLPLDPDGGDANYRKLLANADAFIKGKLAVPGRRCAREKKVPVMTDTDRFILIMELMYETGLRVRDAIHFRPSKLVLDDRCASYTTKQIKTGDEVTVFMPLELAKRLQKLTTLYKSYVFYDNSMPWRRFISDVVWRTVSDLGDACGIPDVRPHRFRDSYAVNMLNKNRPIEVMSILLGHRRVETTRKYYNPWVKSRHNFIREQYLAAQQWEQGELAPVIEITSVNDKRRVL